MVLQGEDVREACHCDVLGETKNTGTSISGGNVRWQHRDLRDYFTANVRFPLPPPSARGRRKKRVGWKDKGITARHRDRALETCNEAKARDVSVRSTRVHDVGGMG